MEEKEHPIGYKVVTREMKSLGLRRNPHILQYSVGEWYFLPEYMVVPGDDDYGGIWTAKTLPYAKRLKKYMRNKHGVSTRIFKAYLSEILFKNSNSVKTDGIFLFEEYLNGSFKPSVPTRLAT